MEKITSAQARKASLDWLGTTAFESFEELDAYYAQLAQDRIQDVEVNAWA